MGRSFMERAQRGWVVALSLVACASLPYAGTWSHGFVSYDDNLTITGLPLLRDLSWRTLPRFFVPELRAGLAEYMPLKNLSYAVDIALFGLKPAAFRWQQQLWYAASVLLFYYWLRALLRGARAADRPGAWSMPADGMAWLTAALFALHPVHVESVTWLSGRKDVLSGTFMLAALLCALPRRSRSRPQRNWLWLAALSCMSLALLSKPMAVVLPALFMLQDSVCREPHRSLRACWRERATLYVVSFALAVGFALFYRNLVPAETPTASALERSYSGPWFARVGQQVLWFGALCLAPARLAPMQPPDLLDPSPLSPLALAGYVTLLALLAGGALCIAKRHPLAIAIGLFLIPLAPILVSPPWEQYVAGRYLFHAVGGVLFALVWLGARLLAIRPRYAPAAVAGSALLGLWLAVSTLDYNRDWKDGLSLWLGSLQKYPRNPTLYKLASHAALEGGRIDLALPILERCLQLFADEPHCSGTLGVLMLRIEPARGEALLRRALPRDSDGAAHVALARYLSEQGQSEQALQLYARWLRSHTAHAAQLEELVKLAMRAKRYDIAWEALRQEVRVGAQQRPVMVAPLELIREVSAARGDVGLQARVDDALAKCSLADCVQRALGW